MSPVDRQSLLVHEATVNVALARLLRDDFGLDAQAELVVAGRRPDVLVQRASGPVVIESEFAPARSVDNDALAKLFLKVGGREVGVTIALVLPSELREVHEADLSDRLRASEFKWREWHAESDLPPLERGSIGDLANAVVLAAARSNYLIEAVVRLEEGAYAAGSRLYYSPLAMSAVARVFNRGESREVANMAALMCINAMVFHDRLSCATTRVPMVPRRDGPDATVSRAYVEELASIWSRILEIDYRPIFEQPLGVLREVPLAEAAHFVSECVKTSRDMIDYIHLVGHDVMGQVFNRLVADRKFLAAYYTSIPAATLLAGLALAPSGWPGVDWSKPDSLRDFAVLDPACGTGTLLMASYQQIIQNHRASRQVKSSKYLDRLHPILIEDTIHGADVVDAAIHVTASMLASMSPKATFESMNVHVFPLGIDQDDAGSAKIGSLEWLDTQSVWSMFSGAAKQVSSNGSRTKAQVPRPEANLVIANPPFRRHNSATGEGDYKTRVFGHAEEDAEELSARLSEVVDGTPANLVAGLASAFVLLADRAIEASGRLAFVLPASFLFGTSWRGIREMLAHTYQVEWVVALHGFGRQSLSYDTGIAETMIVARKLDSDETPPRTAKFVNLWRRPEFASEASAVHRQIQRVPAGVHQINGPPVGGTELALGSDKWGEVVEAPIDGDAWVGSRWRSAVVGQYAWALVRGELYTSDGTEVAATLPVTGLESVCAISPYHLKIKGSRGAFDIQDGWEHSVRYPALWHVDSRQQRTMLNTPNARLLPKTSAAVGGIWPHAGGLHLACDIRYNAQRIAATLTDATALGVTSWFTLQVNEDDDTKMDGLECALTLWFNTTLGLLCHANHANRSQLGRGRGNRTMLRTLPVLDVRTLEEWQLAAAQRLYTELKGAEFKPFFKCAIDPTRIMLDERFLTEVMAAESEAVESLAAVRYNLAQEPSICGTKQPMLPSSRRSRS